MIGRKALIWWGDSQNEVIGSLLLNICVNCHTSLCSLMRRHQNSVIPQLGSYRIGEIAVKSAIALDVTTVDNPE